MHEALQTATMPSAILLLLKHSAILPLVGENHNIIETHLQ